MNSPAATWISPMYLITPFLPSASSMPWPTLNSAIADGCCGIREEERQLQSRNLGSGKGDNYAAGTARVGREQKAVQVQ